MRNRMRGTGVVRGLAAATAVLAAAGGLAACSSSGGGSDGGGSGSTVTIMGVLDLSGTNGAYTQYKNAMQASVDGANARKVPGSHKLKIEFCDAAANANASAACGQKAASDHVAGVVTLASSATYEPYLRKAGIPVVDIMLDPTMYTSPVSFSIFGGGLANSSGFASGAKSLGCQKVVLVAALGQPANIVAKQEAAFKKTADQAGLATGDSVTAPAGTPDMSPFITKALNSNPDCLVLQGYGADGVGLVKATIASGKNVKIISGGSYFTSDSLTTLGADATKIDFVSVSLPQTSTNATVQQWASDITKYSPNPKSFEGGSSAEWACVQLLAYATGHISGTVNSKAMLSYLSKLKDYNPGMLPVVDFADTPPSNPAGDRAFAPYAILQTYKDGKFYALNDGAFYNVFTGAKVPLTPLGN